jgi:hypothetical protein
MNTIWRTFSIWPLTGFIIWMVLQYIPYTGIFLMMIGGPLWSGVFVLAFLAALVVDGLSGRLPKVVLVVPGVFLGWYYAMYVAEGAKIASLEAEFKAANPVKAMTVDFSRQALVAENAAALVSQYRVPVAYEVNRNYEEEGYLSYRVVPSTDCAGIARDPLSRVFTSAFIRYMDETGARKVARNLCLLRMPEKPRGEIVSVTSQTQKLSGFDGVISIVAHTLKRGDDVVGRYRTGGAQRLSAFPLPIAGCFLNSGAPSWDCDAGFWRSHHALDVVPEGAGNAVRVNPVAIMLGLERYSSADMENFQFFAESKAAVERAVADKDRQVIEAFSQLHEIAADPTRETPWRFGHTLSSDPALLAKNADLVASSFLKLAMQAKAERKGRSLSHAREIAHAVAALPEAALQRHGADILAAVQDDRWWDYRPELYVRLADLGAPAYAMYRRDFMENRIRGWLSSVPVQGLCKLEEVEEQVLDAMQSRLAGIDRKRDYRLHQALFLALLRHGRTEAARQAAAAGGLRHAKWYQDVLAGYRREDGGLPNGCALRR